MLLAGDELGERGLHDFWIVQEPVEIVEKQQRRAVFTGQRRQRAQHSQRIAGTHFRASVCRPVRETQAAGDIPHGHFPVLLLGVLNDLVFSFVGFVALHIEPGYVELDITGLM